jgi:hypothetical protein
MFIEIQTPSKSVFKIWELCSQYRPCNRIENMKRFITKILKVNIIKNINNIYKK